MKFLHTIGAIGMMGAMACLIVLLSFAPAPPRPIGKHLLGAIHDRRPEMR